jgi:hypothetical protein
MNVSTTDPIPPITSDIVPTRTTSFIPLTTTTFTPTSAITKPTTTSFVITTIIITANGTTKTVVSSYAPHTTTTQVPQAKTESSGKMSGGAIAGISIAGSLFVLSVIMVYAFRKWKLKVMLINADNSHPRHSSRGFTTTTFNNCSVFNDICKQRIIITMLDLEIAKCQSQNELVRLLIDKYRRRVSPNGSGTLLLSTNA